MEENYNTTKMEDQDETEDTLSFCDLLINSSDTTEWENSTKENQSLSSSSDQEFFEFFSEDWSSSTTYPHPNIQFCGKLISTQEPVPIKTTDDLEDENPEKPKSRFVFRWKLSCFSKQGNPKSQPKSIFWRSRSAPVKFGRRMGKGCEKHSFLRRSLSALASPAKLSVLGFGVPAEMELTDIKRRQSRRNPPAALFLGGGDEKVGGGIGLWAMIISLGCGGGLRWNAVEVAVVDSVGTSLRRPSLNAATFS